MHIFYTEAQAVARYSFCPQDLLSVECCSYHRDSHLYHGPHTHFLVAKNVHALSHENELKGTGARTKDMPPLASKFDEWIAAHAGG